MWIEHDIPYLETARRVTAELLRRIGVELNTLSAWISQIQLAFICKIKFMYLWKQARYDSTGLLSVR